MEDYKNENPGIELDLSDEVKFNKIFILIDKDESGEIDKEEMTSYIKILI